MALDQQWELEEDEEEEWDDDSVGHEWRLSSSTALSRLTKYSDVVSRNFKTHQYRTADWMGAKI